MTELNKDMAQMTQMINDLLNKLEDKGEAAVAKKAQDASDNYEETRTEKFKKYPALKEAWEQYQLVEKMYGP